MCALPWLLGTHCPLPATWHTTSISQKDQPTHKSKHNKEKHACCPPRSETQLRGQLQLKLLNKEQLTRTQTCMPALVL